MSRQPMVNKTTKGRSMGKPVRKGKGSLGLPKNLSVFIYPETKGEAYIAQCLDLDIIGMDKSVEGALQELLELIDVQYESCEKTGASVRFRSSESDWDRYKRAQESGTKVPLEIIERIVSEVNLVNRHIKFHIYASSRVPKKCLQPSV